jgi:glycosyltransferase involved in cell wall biosynthesis
MHFTVLTPTHNRVEWLLPECIESVRLAGDRLVAGDSYTHVVVDDASTDGTWAFLTAAAGRLPRLQIHRNSVHAYVSRSLNVGLARSAADVPAALSGGAGDIVLPLDDDDLLLPDSLLKHRDFLLDNPQVEWTFGDADLIDELGRPTTPGKKRFNSDRYAERSDALFEMLLGQCVVMNGTVAVRRRAIDLVGGWDEGIAGHHDLAMWLALAAARQPHAKQFGVALSAYRIRQGGAQISTAAGQVERRHKNLMHLAVKYGRDPVVVIEAADRLRAEHEARLEAADRVSVD